MTIDFSKVCLLSEFIEELTSEADEILLLASEGRDFLTSHKWCKNVVECYVGIAVGGVVGVFLFNIEPEKGADDWLWVIVGDLPPAYLVIDASPNPACALYNYIGEMEDWVRAVKNGESVKNVIPVNAPATIENAIDLERRLRFLERWMVQDYLEDLEYL